MENRFEKTSAEEQQGWGAYIKPPSYGARSGDVNAGTRAGQPPATPPRSQRPAEPAVALCTRVRDILPRLLENDGDIRPEMTGQFYAHLATCPGCAREFDEMQQVVKMVESLQPADMPMDFSGIIMRRIRLEYADTRGGPIVRPTQAASSPVGGEAAVEEDRPAVLQAAELAPMHAATLAGASVSRLDQIGHVSVLQSTRVSAAAVTCGMLAFFLSFGWGRAMLSANVATSETWLAQVAAAVRRVPLLGWIVTLLVSVLAQVQGLLEETYRTLGAAAAQGLAIDAALCALAYYMLVARKAAVRRT